MIIQVATPAPVGLFVENLKKDSRVKSITILHDPEYEAVEIIFDCSTGKELDEFLDDHDAIIITNDMRMPD